MFVQELENVQLQLVNEGTRCQADITHLTMRTQLLQKNDIPTLITLLK